MKRIQVLLSLRRKQVFQTLVWVVALLFTFPVLEAQTVADYRLEKVGPNLFQVVLIPNDSYSSPLNRVNTLQVSMRVRTGGFSIANVNSLLPGITFITPPGVTSPLENSNYDYFIVPMQPTGSDFIPFQQNVEVPLFTFQNNGICTSDTLSLVLPDDPFYFPNSQSVDISQVFTILGDAGTRPAGVDPNGIKVADCENNAIVEYEIQRLNNGLFQVCITPNVTYDAPSNRIGNMQFTIRVAGNGFVPGNITNLLNTGTPDEVMFANNGRTDNPPENPGFDYISFNLVNPDTMIPFIAGNKVPLFTFGNVGLCTEDTVRLITPDDPFHSSNTGSTNFDQQLSITGYGVNDAPITVVGSGATDCTRECFMGCNDNVQVSLGINCTAEVRPEMVATALNLTCPNGPKGVEILENGAVIPTSPFLDASHIGRTFTVRVIDSLTSNSCWGSIIVNDKTAPILNCEDDTLSCAVQDVSPDNPLFGYPIANDNCSGAIGNFTYSDRVIRNGCGPEFSARLERTWTAVDAAGMVGTCVQNYYFRSQTLANVVFPANRDGISGPAIDCTDGAADPANVGAPSIDGNALYPFLVGFCQIDAGFRDDTVSFCVGNMQIVRTWTVVDGCTGANQTEIQIISVIDTTPPVIQPIDTIEAVVDQGICNGTVTFPTIDAADACSGARITIETAFGNTTDGGTIGWIPQGYHQINVIATDSCNNSASQLAVLHVADRTPPVAACDFINDVVLRPSGTVDVYAMAFDDGSRDGCTGNQLILQVQRVGSSLPFADFVSFDCMDAGDTINVNMLVTDLHGNSDQCVAAIVITDDTPPVISCPSDTTIQCEDDYSNLALFGMPTIVDDCGGASNYTETDSFEINSCGTGRIIRTFTVNYGGATVSCDQIITIQNPSVFDGNTIVWPLDYDGVACSGNSLEPDDLPINFDIPRYDSTGSLCNRILRYRNDAIFDDVTNPVGCYTILRTWAIIDWCVFDANDTLAGGYWSHVQQIDLVNIIPPTFTTCPSDFAVDAVSNTCGAAVNLNMTATDDCTPSNQLRYSYTIDLDSNGSTDLTGNTSDASGNYPVGNHRIRYTVRDDCDNFDECNFVFTVRDNTPPVAICNTDTFDIVNIGGGVRMAVINARLLALGSTDDCTPFDSLTITASPTSFDCTQLGLAQVSVKVSDKALNADSCLIDVFIRDGAGICPGPRTAVRISGVITNEMGERVDQVEVSINHPEVAAAMTNNNGEFSLKEVPIGNDYTILPSRDFDILNGISTFDLVLISRHILAIEKIQSPYRLIAADVNRSGGITAYDIVQLRKLILRTSTTFPNNTSWRFVRTDFSFEHPTESHSHFFPEVYNINDLPDVDMEIEGFVAVKVGDINGSANTQSAFTEGESRNANGQMTLNINNKEIEAGETLEIPVTSSNISDLLGFQFALQFEPTDLELEKVEAPKLAEGNFGWANIDRGLLTVSWEQATLSENTRAEEVLFTLHFKAKQSTSLSQVLTLNHNFMKSEAYSENSSGAIELLDVVLDFDHKRSTAGFHLYQNRPNPFSVNSIIGFDLDQSEKVNLSILDITGKMVKQVQYEAEEGYNELIINRKELKGKGVYYYQLATSQGMQTKKLIVVE